MTDRRDSPKKKRIAPGALGLDIDRLARKAGVSREDAYAFLCTGYTGSGGSSWMDKHVSNDVLKHLRALDE
jgi:hypothetical protein